jgi:hypothetical protein
LAAGSHTGSLIFSFPEDYTTIATTGSNGRVLL